MFTLQYNWTGRLRQSQDKCGDAPSKYRLLLAQKVINHVRVAAIGQNPRRAAMSIFGQSGGKPRWREFI